MHQYLRAWRLHLKLTLADVAAHLGVKHSTVSRWERGALPVNSKNLAALAALYGCTDRQLVGGPPNEAAAVQMIDEIQEIIGGLDPDDRDHWIATGRAMSRRPKAA